MSIFSFVLEMYFAVMLCVSGLSKLNELVYFKSTLRQQGVLPSWSIDSAAKSFPLIEIFLSLFLISGVLLTWSSLFLFGLFVTFAILKIVLLLRRYDKDCGCFGSAKPEQVNSTSVIVSIFLVVFAGLHMWLALYAPFTNLTWRLSLFSIVLIVVIYFAIKIFIRNKNLSISG